MGQNSVKVVLPYPPSLNRMYRTACQGGRSRIYKSAEGVAYQQSIKLYVPNIEPLVGSVAVSIAVYRPQKRGDIDNVLKCLLDALNGILWLDDSQIVRLLIERYDDKANPRAVVVVSKQ